MLLAAPLRSSEKQSHTSIFQRKPFKWGIGIIVSLSLLGGGFLLGAQANPLASITTAIKNPTIQEEVKLNKAFSFPVDNDQGQKVTDISYTVASVDKQNEIIIKGERAQAVEGKTFLIVNLTLVNSSNQTIQLDTRDYIRLTIGKDKDLLASDIHNDPVIIQPISTVYTRLGFPIDSNAKQVTLHVGELNGSKTNIPITFTL